MRARILLVMVSMISIAPSVMAKEPKNWREPTEPFQIVGPVYFIGTKGLGVYLIKTDAGLILLSGAMPKSTPFLTHSIRKLGFALQDVKLLLVTHAHLDHVGTLAEMKKLTNASVVVMEADAALLQSGGNTDYLYAKRPDMHFEAVKADKIIKDGETVNLGALNMLAHGTPGHTPGCTTWETNIEHDGKKYNVVFPDCTSVNPGTRFKKDPSYPGIAEDYKRTFTVLESLHPDIFLSYHAEFFGLEEKRQRMTTAGIKAWIDPEGYKRRINEKKATFEKLLSEETTK